MLNRVKESRIQLRKLERFARRRHALPLYLLYNHSPTAERSKHWHCQQPFSKRQLGCILVPSWQIRRMLDRPPRDFHSAHNVGQSRPWRCVFDCPCAKNELKRAAKHGADAWPFALMEDARLERLFRTSSSRLTRTEFDDSIADDAPRDSIALDEGRLYPARFLMVDRSQEPSVQSK